MNLQDACSQSYPQKVSHNNKNRQSQFLNNTSLLETTQAVHSLHKAKVSRVQYQFPSNNEFWGFWLINSLKLPTLHHHQQFYDHAHMAYPSLVPRPSQPSFLSPCTCSSPCFRSTVSLSPGLCHSCSQTVLPLLLGPPCRSNACLF